MLGALELRQLGGLPVLALKPGHPGVCLPLGVRKQADARRAEQQQDEERGHPNGDRVFEQRVHLAAVPATVLERV